MITGLDKEDTKEFIMGCVQAKEDEDALEQSASIGFHTWLAVFSSCFCPFIGYWITVHTAFFYTYPATSLNAGVNAAWLPVAFSTVNASLNSCLAQLAEIFGRKRVILGLVIIGSVLLGGCLANEGVFFAIPSEVLPRRYRGFGQCLFSLTGGFACTAAVLVNGALLQAFPVDGWRYGYYLLASLIALASIAIGFLYHPATVQKIERSSWERLRSEVDWIGSILQCAWVVPLMVALTWGGSAYGWNDAHVIAMFTMGGTFLVIFILHQTAFKKDGILHHGMFASRNLALCLGGCFVEGLIFLVFNSQYPAMLSTVWDVPAFYQAVRFFPMYIVFGGLSPAWGLWTKKYREYKVPLVVGWAFTIIAAAMLATADESDVNIGIGAAILAGAGLAAPFALLISWAQLGVPVQLLGLVTARGSSVRALGICIGTTISVQLYTSRLKVELPVQVIAAVTKLGVSRVDAKKLASAIAASSTADPSVSPEVFSAAQHAAYDARVTAFHVPWFWVIAWSVVAIILVLSLDSNFIRNRMTWEIERPIQEKHFVVDDEVQQ